MTDQISGRENTRHENARHENAGHEIGGKDMTDQAAASNTIN